MMSVRVTEITGYVADEYGDSVEDSINEGIKCFEDDYDVRVISINITKGGALEHCKYSVWIELRRRDSDDRE